jgi:hypothetical protein
MDYSSSYEDQEHLRTNSFLDKLTWLFKGFVYPIWNRPYYRDAANKSLGTALVFLLIFAILQSLVTTYSVAANLNQFGEEIEAAFASGEIPDITISNGIASVSGKGKYTFESNRQLVAVDVTGSMLEIDTTQYSEGILLTRDEFHVVNEDGYQVLSLSDLNQSFGNPIVINADSLTNLWSKIVVVLNLIVAGGGFLFYSLGRFFYLALLGLLVWGVVSINKQGFDFGKILITGIYANVPTTYLIFLLDKVGISFFGLRGVILFVFWGIALAFILKEEQSLEEELTPFNSA